MLMLQDRKLFRKSDNTSETVDGDKGPVGNIYHVEATPAMPNVDELGLEPPPIDMVAPWAKPAARQRGWQGGPVKAAAPEVLGYSSDLGLTVKRRTEPGNATSVQTVPEGQEGTQNAQSTGRSNDQRPAEEPFSDNVSSLESQRSEKSTEQEDGTIVEGRGVMSRPNSIQRATKLDSERTQASSTYTDSQQTFLEVASLSVPNLWSLTAGERDFD